VPSWLVVSLVASLVLTVLLNAVLRLSPRARQGLETGVERLVDHAPPPRTDELDQPRVRVIIPWKLMLIGSILVTVVVNLFLALRP
jgi:hypothetical protein